MCFDFPGGRWRGILAEDVHGREEVFRVPVVPKEVQFREEVVLWARGLLVLEFPVGGRLVWLGDWRRGPTAGPR